MNDTIGPAGEETPERPPGDYAIVELFGHQTLVGRVEEVERFGSKMLAIESVFNGELLPTVYYGGASIYGLTPCSADVAFARGATNLYQLPTAMRAIVPPLMLPAPDDARRSASYAEDDDEDVF